MLKLYFCVLLVIGIFYVAKTCMYTLQDAIMKWIDTNVMNVSCRFSIYSFIYLFDFQAHRHLQGHMASSSFLMVEEDPTRTNIEKFVGMGRTTDVPQVSWKASLHESWIPDRDSNARGEGLSDWKPRTSTIRPRTPLIFKTHTKDYDMAIENLSTI